MLAPKEIGYWTDRLTVLMSDHTSLQHTVSQVPFRSTAGLSYSFFDGLFRIIYDRGRGVIGICHDDSLLRCNGRCANDQKANEQSEQQESHLRTGSMIRFGV